MRQDGQGMSHQEKLRADNDYMKMKLMLERGAKFGTSDFAGELPPEIENRFLRNVIEFESLNEKRAFVKVYEKLGCPRQFIPVDRVPDAEIDAAWKELLGFLNQHQVTIGVCSPNVKTRELYRFVTEELFDQQISSVDLPGLVHGFIYDEFHPDPSFDNPRSVIEGFLEPLFSERQVENIHFFRRFDLRLNEHYPLTQRQFMNLLNHFKKRYDQFAGLKLGDIGCTVHGAVSEVTGDYQVECSSGGSQSILEGSWTVTLAEHAANGVWDICSVQIGGIDF
ncbi:MAG: hypothetical protein EOO05_06065 [Chitinophagaceae bacterium]|nr:MAG: hypothetical protein EOO05_06065 [Chitinophagaceae bacterium]